MLASVAGLILLYVAPDVLPETAVKALLFGGAFAGTILGTLTLAWYVGVPRLVGVAVLVCSVALGVAGLVLTGDADVDPPDADLPDAEISLPDADPDLPAPAAGGGLVSPGPAADARPGVPLAPRGGAVPGGLPAAPAAIGGPVETSTSVTVGGDDSDERRPTGRLDDQD